jgi:hypothetical protein
MLRSHRVPVWLHKVLRNPGDYAVLQHAASVQYWKSCEGKYEGAAELLPQLYEHLLLCCGC